MYKNRKHFPKIVKTCEYHKKEENNYYKQLLLYVKLCRKNNHCKLVCYKEDVYS